MCDFEISRGLFREKMLRFAAAIRSPMFGDSFFGQSDVCLIDYCFLSAGNSLFPKLVLACFTHRLIFVIFLWQMFDQGIIRSVFPFLFLKCVALILAWNRQKFRLWFLNSDECRSMVFRIIFELFLPSNIDVNTRALLTLQTRS